MRRRVSKTLMGKSIVFEPDNMYHNYPDEVPYKWKALGIVQLSVVHALEETLVQLGSTIGKL